MSGELLVFAGSLAGVAVLIFVSWALGLGRGARIADDAEARELADNAICGFDAREIALDAHGRAALLQDTAGRVLLIKLHGAQFAAQLLDSSARVSRNRSALTVAGVTLELGSAAGAWETRLKALNS